MWTDVAAFKTYTATLGTVTANRDDQLIYLSNGTTDLTRQDTANGYARGPITMYQAAAFETTGSVWTGASSTQVNVTFDLEQVWTIYRVTAGGSSGINSLYRPVQFYLSYR